MKISIYSIILPRLEVFFLDEWIEHYLRLGVDHIYIYDNGFRPVDNGDVNIGRQRKLLSDEVGTKWDKKPEADYFLQYSEGEIINKLYHEIPERYDGRVSIVPWRYGFEHKCKYPTSQLRGMRHCTRTFDSKWWLFVDPDEFLILKKHNTIRDFIHSLNSTVNAIWVCQQIYNTRQYKRPISTIEPYSTVCIPKYKSLVCNIKKHHIHQCVPRSGDIEQYDNDETIIIKHYMGKPMTNDYIRYFGS